VSRATLDRSVKRELRELPCSEKHFRIATVDAMADQALDKTLEESFPASDPPSTSMTRVGKPKRFE
jgi:hypothetical protein